MFGRRYHILKIAGLDLGMDLSWLMIALLVTWTLALGLFPSSYPGLTAGTYWIMGFVGMLGLFLSVVLHEMGHAFMARKFGQPISRITLFIFGGVAEMKEESSSPKVEFWVAIAGPLVTLAIILLTGLFTSMGRNLEWPVTLTGITGYLALVNTIILVFNLIPAFPLDGGRVLRSFLWWWKGNLGWATKVTSHLGAGFGFFLIFSGLFLFISGNFIGGLWWVLIGLFLREAASGSRVRYAVERLLENEKVEKFMVKDPITVTPEITVQQFIEDFVYTSYHHLYPVAEGDRFLGYMSLEEVKLLDQAQWKTKTVNEVMVPAGRCPKISLKTSALKALKMFNEKGATVLFVVEEGFLIGLLTNQDLLKTVSLHLELQDGMGG